MLHATQRVGAGRCQLALKFPAGSLMRQWPGFILRGCEATTNHQHRPPVLSFDAPDALWPVGCAATGEGERAQSDGIADGRHPGDAERTLRGLERRRPALVTAAASRRDAPALAVLTALA